MKSLTIIAMLLALTLGGPARAAAPTPFTAHFQLLKNGKPLGEAVMRMRRADGHWLFTTDSKATHGLAGLFGLTITEASHFRMRDGQPEVLEYRYHLDAKVMDDQRSVNVDWQSMRTTTTREDGSHHYPAVRGMVSKQMLPWVLSRHLHKGDETLQAIVAVKDAAETQHYVLAGHDTLDTPMGPVDTVRVDRNDPGKNYIAWYAPGRFPVPVKLTHDEYSLKLQSYSTR